MTPIGTAPSTPQIQPSQTEKLRTLSIDLETTFLTEMLKHSGLGKGQDAFGGGIGEEQFTSMRLHEIAKQITQSGGIGIAENIFQSLIARAE